MHLIIWPPSLLSAVFSPLPTAPDQTHSDRGWDPEAQEQGKGLELLPRVGAGRGCKCQKLSEVKLFVSGCGSGVGTAGEAEGAVLSGKLQEWMMIWAG